MRRLSDWRTPKMSPTAYELASVTAEAPSRHADLEASERRELAHREKAVGWFVAGGKATWRLKPKYSAGGVTPLNSVLMTIKFRRNSPPTEYQAQNRPKRSVMSLARPTPV